MILAIHGIVGSQIVQSTPLLDLYPNAAAAYSLRKLRTAYTGIAIRVRRAVGSPAEKDIGFVNNVLDVSDLQSFCSGTNGFVTTWYDQSGNGRDASQTTAANQSEIVNSDSIITSGSKSALQNGSTKGAKTGIITFSSYSEIWLYAVLDITTVSPTQVVFETSTNVNSNIGSFLIYIENTRLFVYEQINGYSIVSCAITTGRKLISVKIKTNTTASLAYDIYINGVLQSKTLDNNNNSVSFTNQILSLMSRNSNSFGFLGKTQECVIFSGDQSANNTGINNNINSYYGIY